VVFGAPSLDGAMPTYAGELGVLAGDLAASDLGVLAMAITLLRRKGYFRQRLDGASRQHARATRLAATD
jgi:starch phosphorylase